MRKEKKVNRFLRSTITSTGSVEMTENLPLIVSARCAVETSGERSRTMTDLQSHNVTACYFRRFRIKCGMTVAVLLLLLSPIYAIDAYVADLYREIDTAFVQKSDKQLDSILSKNVSDDNYYLIENYALKKVRHLVIAQDYDFAMQANLVIIDNDMDNVDAVEMYSTIANAIEKQKEQERYAEQQQQLLAAARAREKEKQKVATAKDFQSVKTATGEDIYLKDKHEKFSRNRWQFRFGLVNLDLISEADESYNSLRYGISADFNYDYSFDKLLVGFDLAGDVVLIPFSNNDDTMLGSFLIAPKIGLAKISRIFYLRVGFAGFIMHNGGDTSVLMGNFLTPLIGVGFNHLKAGIFTFSDNVDWNFGHFAYSDINFAMSIGANMCMTMTEMDKVRLTFNVGLKDDLFAKSAGVENKARLILAIGVENVAK